MSATSIRCSIRKHVIEDGNQFCDCGGVMLGKTAARNAHVVTLHWDVRVATPRSSAATISENKETET